MIPLLVTRWRLRVDNVDVGESELVSENCLRLCDSSSCVAVGVLFSPMRIELQRFLMGVPISSSLSAPHHHTETSAKGKHPPSESGCRAWPNSSLGGPSSTMVKPCSSTIGPLRPACVCRETCVHGDTSEAHACCHSNGSLSIPKSTASLCPGPRSAALMSVSSSS